MRNYCRNKISHDSTLRSDAERVNTHRTCTHNIKKKLLKFQIILTAKISF